MKKLTINTFSKIEKSIPSIPHTIPFDVDGEVINIEVKPYISLQLRSDIIDSSAQAAWTDSGMAYEYKEAVFKYKIIDTLTNIPTLKKKDTIDLARYTEIYDRLNLEEKIKNINDYMFCLIEDLKTAINEKLDYQKQLVYHSSNTDELVDAVVNFLSTATATVEKFGESMSGLDVGQLSTAIGKFTKGAIDPGLLKGILDTGSAVKVDTGSQTASNLEVVK